MTMINSNLAFIALAFFSSFTIAFIKVRYKGRSGQLRVEPYSRVINPSDFVHDQILEVRKRSRNGEVETLMSNAPLAHAYSDEADEHEQYDDESSENDYDDRDYAEHDDSDYSDGTGTGLHTHDVLLNDIKPKANQSTYRTSGEIVIINVMADKGQEYTGYELLQSLLAADLRHGEMSIFHYYQAEGENRRVLFSLASAQEPGTFNIQQMGGFTCNGLSLFMQCRGDDTDQAAFDLMLATAKQLAEELGGSLKGAQREPFTSELIHDVRQRLVSKIASR